MTDRTMIRTPARFYVATFGDMGLEVRFFDDSLEYARAVKEAKRDHERGYNEWGEVDSYTNGACEIVRFVKGVAA
ncbi:MAG: hypothetical protein AAFX78_02655 [Cyanobacteria bacterium J06638_20]